MLSGIGFATVLMFGCAIGFSITRIWWFLVLGVAIGVMEMIDAVKIWMELSKIEEECEEEEV